MRHVAHPESLARPTGFERPESWTLWRTKQSVQMRKTHVKRDERGNRHGWRRGEVRS